MESGLAYFILFVIGIGAGFLNVIAGGGSNIVLPVLILMGYDASLANGSNRIAIILQNISAIASFRRENYSQFTISLKLSLLTLPGAIAGAILAVSISDKTFELILGIVMMAIIITMLIPQRKAGERSGKISFWIYPAMIGAGFYGGFIQAGVGFVLMAIMFYISKMDLITINMHKVFIVLVYTIPSLIIFIVSGNVDFVIGLIIGCGSAIGGWWAAKFSVRNGEKYIRIILILAIFIMSFKLLGIF